jgi:hypothetical protein
MPVRRRMRRGPPMRLRSGSVGLCRLQLQLLHLGLGPLLLPALLEVLYRLR